MQVHNTDSSDSSDLGPKDPDLPGEFARFDLDFDKIQAAFSEHSGGHKEARELTKQVDEAVAYEVDKASTFMSNDSDLDDLKNKAIGIIRNEIISNGKVIDCIAPYARKVLKNQQLNRNRKQKRLPKTFDISLFAESDHPYYVEESRTCPWLSTFESVDEAINWMKRSCSSDNWMLLQLRFLEGKSVSEIAQIIIKPEDTIRHQISRLCTRLLEAFNKYELRRRQRQ